MADQITILLVEDDVFDVEAVERSLAAVTSPIFELSQVATFREALQIVKTTSFHLVILDLGLPDSSGLSGLERLVAAIPHIPIIVLTGQDDEKIALHAIELGAQEFLDKGSVGPKELVRAIRHAAKRKQCETRSSQGGPASPDLEKIIRETSGVICNRVELLKKTKLTEQQHSLVVEIDKNAKASLERARAISSESEDPDGPAQHGIEVSS